MCGGRVLTMDEHGPSRIEIEIVVERILDEKETDVYRMESNEFVRVLLEEYEYSKDAVKDSIVHEVERLGGPRGIHLTRSGRSHVELIDISRTSTEDSLFPGE